MLIPNERNNVARPFKTYVASEIVSAPKMYGFDTGFVCYYRGWNNLRREDLGYLFEHVVLNEVLGRFPNCKMRYWRDKSKNEVDFIYSRNRQAHHIAIECKWSANNFNGKSMNRFRKLYPNGENIVVVSDVETSYIKTVADIKVRFVNIVELIKILDLNPSLGRERIT